MTANSHLILGCSVDTIDRVDCKNKILTKYTIPKYTIYTIYDVVSLKTKTPRLVVVVECRAGCRLRVITLSVESDMADGLVFVDAGIRASS